ncbi:MAG: TonB-dependent receptor [Candidatus Aminicenantales bacterium]
MRFPSSKAFFSFVLVLVAVGVLTAGTALAQSTSATLEGFVKETGGEGLPGATVNVLNAETGFQRGATSRPDGSYIISGIIPGTYKVEASLSGFTSQVRTDVVLAVGGRIKIDFALPQASLNAEVQVVAEAPLIEVSKSEISSVVNRAQIESLPLLNRDFSDLSIIKAGVLEGVSNAQPVGSGEMVVDGISNESVGSNTLGTMLPADAIQEFRVITNQATAEFGNMSGMVTTAITRSGTNELQGRLSFFYRDEAFDSVNYFANHAEYNGPELPKDQWEESPYSRTDVSGFIGGPIVKDKAHFFLSFERVDAKDYTMITSPLVDRQSVEQKSWNYIIMAKFNYQLNKTNQFSLRLNMAPSSAGNQGIGGMYTLEQAYAAKTQSYSAVAEWTWFPSANTMNELRLNFSKSKYQNETDVYSYEIDRPSGYLGKNSNQPQDGYEDKFEIVDNFNLFLGRHSIKAGADFITAPSGIENMYLYMPGIFIFTTDAPFNPANFGTYPYMFQYNSSTKPITIDMPYTMLGAFVQDSWKVTSNFTLNYGLRYNYYDLTGLDFKAFSGSNFNPRIAFSWDPSGMGKSSIRGGIGTYTANLSSATTAPIIFWSQFALRVRIFPGYPDPFAPNPFFPPIIDFAADTGDYTTSELAAPYSLQASIGYQRELTKDIAVSADLVYTRGYNLLRRFNQNPVIPGTSYEHVNPDIGNVWVVECAGKSEYKGLYLNFNKRYSQGWSLDVAYTFSKSDADTDSMGGDVNIDAGSITMPWTYDANGWERAYGRTTYDARHKITVTGLVDLPWGFQLSGLFFYRSAYPWNAVYAEDVNLDGLTGDYVDYYRNSREGFDEMWLNVRLSKFFRFDKLSFQLFAEGFNLTNRVNYWTVNNVYGAPGFGNPITAADPRLIQLGVRIDWN